MHRTLDQLVRDEQLLDEEALQAAMRRAHAEGIAPVLALTRSSPDGGGPLAPAGPAIDEHRLAEALCRRLRLPRVHLDQVFVELDAVREVAWELANGRCLLPLSIERTTGRRLLKLAMADPLDAAAIEEIEASTGCRVDAAVALPSEIAPAVHKHYRGMTTKLIPRHGAQLASEAARASSLPTPGPAVPAARVASSASVAAAGDAPIELRFRALLAALIDRGAVAEDDYLAALRRLREQSPE